MIAKYTENSVIKEELQRRNESKWKRENANVVACDENDANSAESLQEKEKATAV